MDDQGPPQLCAARAFGPSIGVTCNNGLVRLYTARFGHWLLQGVARPDPGHPDVAILIDDMLCAREVFTSLVLASFHIEPLIGGDAAEQD